MKTYFTLSIFAFLAAVASAIISDSDLSSYVHVSDGTMNEHHLMKESVDHDSSEKSKERRLIKGIKESTKREFNETRQLMKNSKSSGSKKRTRRGLTKSAKKPIKVESSNSNGFDEARTKLGSNSRPKKQKNVIGTDTEPHWKDYFGINLSP